MKDRKYLYPLRKIVGCNGRWDVLECGHELLEASDMYGFRFPDKRRCRHCWKELSDGQKDKIRKKK